MSRAKKPLEPSYAFGWHFRRSDGLGYRDGRQPKKGERLAARTLKGTEVKRPTHCQSGMHALYRINPAFRGYGPILSYVMVENPVFWSYDPAKFAGTHRTVLWEVDLSGVSILEIESAVREAGFDEKKAQAYGKRLLRKWGRK